MIAVSLSRWARPIRTLIWLAAAVTFGVLNATGQQADDLQQQLQQLKRQYVETTRQLEERIAVLEHKIEEQKESAAKEKEGTVSAAELAAQEAAKKAVQGKLDQVGANYQGEIASEPTYDLLQEAEQKIATLQQEASAFEFHGYLRSGYGLNSQGGQQVAFEAPGADAKYRLGNEAETYGEFIFVNNWLNPQHASDKAWMKTEVMIEANTTNSDNAASFQGGVGNDVFRLREAFVQAGNVLDSQPDAKFWAGERYYRRQHVEIDDFYPLDLSGYGAGIEDVHVGIGKLAVAFLAGARPDIVTDNGNLAKSNIDTRWYDIKGPGGLWGGWFDFATSKGGVTTTGTATPTIANVPTTDGYAFGLKHQRLEWYGGYNIATIQYGTGAASNFSNPGNGTTIPNPTPFINRSRQLLFTEQLLFQPNDKFAIMPIVLYQRTKDGNPQDGWNQWVSFGARPEIFFTKHLSLAFEGGFDHTHCSAGCVSTSDTPIDRYDGWLRKFTIAPQIGAGRKFFSRPTYGVQAETWW
jgi:maltoporin